MPNGQYLKLEEIINKIHSDIRLGEFSAPPRGPLPPERGPLSTRRPVKLAISITGGGARGVYEAGVVEAILQALLTARLSPSIITGTSAGAIVGAGFLLDLLYSNNTPPPYSGNQSWLWRQVCDGNDGAKLVAGDRAWVIERYSNKSALVVTDAFQQEVSTISQFTSRLKPQIESVQQQIEVLRGDCETILEGAKTALKNDVDSAQADLDGRAADFRACVERLARHVKEMVDAWMQVDLSSPVVVRQLGLFKPKLEQVFADLENCVTNRTGIVTPELIILLESIPSNLQGIVNRVDDLEAAVANVRAEVTSLVTMIPSINTTLEELNSVAIRLLEDSAVIGKFIDLLLINDRGINLRLTDRLIENVHIRKLLRDLMQKALGTRPAGRPAAQIIVEQWKRQRRPELLLTATNLTASRLTVFALARPETVRALASEGLWTVDLAGDASLEECVLKPIVNRESEPLLDAVMTSATFPMAFPPMKWSLQREVNPGTASVLNHIFVDGGVIDNSPIDLAAKAGATHIISIELKPLMANSWLSTNWPADDSKTYNLANIGYGTFFTAMDGALLSSINSLVARNTENSSRVEIYRLAPLQADIENDRPITPSTFDFDGLYDSNHSLKMSMYDWFMQGYIDARGLTADDWVIDPVVSDYRRAVSAGNRGYVGNAAPANNKFWRATAQALPTSKP